MLTSEPALCALMTMDENACQGPSHCFSQEGLIQLTGSSVRGPFFCCQKHLWAAAAKPVLVASAGVFYALPGCGRPSGFAHHHVGPRWRPPAWLGRGEPG